MGIAWGGACQSNGQPQTYYEYAVETWGRTASSIHVRLKIRVRMKWYSSYFSFAIAHECKVNGVYQSASIKDTRKFWGHQWEGSYYGGGDFYWSSGEYDYDGTVWHGWYTVFDGDVPMDVDDDAVHIVPCITRPPITGLGGGGIYAANDLDKTNWQGRSGVWSPFGTDQHIGSWAWRPLTEDGCFLNNRWLEELGDGLYVGKYPRPANVENISLTPAKVDVANQDTQAVTGSWSASQRAVGYNVQISKGGPGRNPVSLGSVNRNGITLHPRKNLNVSELFDGDQVYIGVYSFDGSGVTSTQTRWGGPVTYYEIPSRSPNAGYLIGRKGEPNQIIYKGESAVLHYSGEYNGSYAIQTYQLVRLSDGVTLTWQRGDAKSSSTAMEKLIALSIPGVDRPRQTRVWELRAFNVKNRAVYMDDNNEWLRISVDYYGGVVYVHDEGWREGICWVWENGTWHESDAVFVYRNGVWETL